MPYLVVESGRMIQKIITASGTAFAVAPSNDHTDGSWSSNHLYDGEFGINSGAIQLAVRVSGTIYYIPLSAASGASVFSSTGTTNYISKWSSSTALANSSVYDNGTNIGIGVSSGFGGKMHIVSTVTGAVLYVTTNQITSDAAYGMTIAYSGTTHGNIGIHLDGTASRNGLFIAGYGGGGGPFGGIYINNTDGTVLINGQSIISSILDESQSIWSAYGSYKVPLVVAGERTVLYNNASATGTVTNLELWAQNVSGTNRAYAVIQGTVVTNANGTEDGKIVFRIRKAGTVTDSVSLLQDQTVVVHALTGSTMRPVSVASGGVLMANTGATDADFTTAGGTITWGGTTAPSGDLDDRYTWNRVGNMVFFWIRLEYSVAGSALTSLIVTLPSDMPTPSSLTGWGNSEIGVPLAGSVATSITGTFQQLRAWFEKDAGGAIRITLTAGSGAYIAGGFSGFYFTA